MIVRQLSKSAAAFAYEFAVVATLKLAGVAFYISALPFYPGSPIHKIEEALAGWQRTALRLVPDTCSRATISMKRQLSGYREKRNLRKSPEPSGKGVNSDRKPIFVIHEHDARNLHYDFRLECNGVLKSWAVSKGPSTDPREKRLAIEVEDHPLDYADFEGVIPEGEYGAGSVIVWDTGPFENITEDDGNDVPLEDGLNHGHIAIRLDGQKLKGGYALTRIRNGKKPQWLLVKMKDNEADARRNPVNTEVESFKTGRTIEEVANEDLE